MAQAPLQPRAAARRSEPIASRSATGPKEQRLADLGRNLNQAQAVQRLTAMVEAPPPSAQAASRAGLPAQLKSGIEALSGVSMDGVRVHRNSSRPAAVQARAYTQGSDIHIAPGQDHHLPHEAWHVVQQAKGRVPSTGRLPGGVPLNDDPGLEREADVMGARAMGTRAAGRAGGPAAAPAEAASGPIQRRAGIEFETSVEARITPPPVQPNEPVPVQDAQTGWVPQDELMAQGQGWHIDSDNSKLEFVTDPPVDIGPLAAVAKTMFDHVEKLPTKLDQKADLATTLGIGTTKPYSILPYKERKLSGAPQGTVGIPFAKLFAFFDLLTKYQMKMSELQFEQNTPAQDKEIRKGWAAWKGMPSSNEQETSDKAKFKEKLINAGKKVKLDETHHRAIPKKDADNFKKVATAVTQSTNAIPDLAGDELAKLRGLLHFIGQYIIYATPEHDSYEKSRFPVMARSSFNSMYAALNQTAKGAFANAADAVVKALGYKTTDILLPGRGPTVSFDVAGWLDSIVHPVEVTIPEKPSRTMTSDFMTAPGSVQHPNGPVAQNTDKSMGSLGLDNGMVVLELRQFRLGYSKNSFTVAAARKLVDDLKALTA